jgi:hypothetical protein
LYETEDREADQQVHKPLVSAICFAHDRFNVPERWQ